MWVSWKGEMKIYDSFFYIFFFLIFYLLENWIKFSRWKDTKFCMLLKVYFNLWKILEILRIQILTRHITNEQEKVFHSNSSIIIIASLALNLHKFSNNQKKKERKVKFSQLIFRSPCFPSFRCEFSVSFFFVNAFWLFSNNRKSFSSHPHASIHIQEE